MSINVTVHGNPISVSRGKMVTYDADSDFERRRRIRLQQVRQQSKEIAANVRNRVRKEKEKQLSKVEKEGEEQLKRWKSRKLLALQQQYRDCLEEIGSAHTRAALERDPHEILNELEEKNQKEAEIRGKLASEKQKDEEVQQKLLLAQPLQRKKQVRNIENARSVMVSKLGRVKTTPIKKKKRKKLATDLTITSNIVSASDTSHNSISDIENISSNIEDTGKQQRKSVIAESDYDSQQDMSRGTKSSPKKQKKMTKKRLTSEDDSLSPDDISKCHVNDTDDDLTPPSFRLDDDVQVSPVINSGSDKNTNIHLSPSKVKDIIEQHRPVQTYTTNTRISDRIRQRKLHEHQDTELRNNNINYISNNFQREPHSSVSNKFNIDSYKICDIENEPAKESNLPYVHPTSVMTHDEDNVEGQTTSKVSYYDHFNRFGKEYNAQPVVQRINKDSIIVHPSTEAAETRDYYETMQRRDKEAQCRGAKAREKNQIQKDYQQLMEELPALQRQERLAQMRTHNPTFHMSDDRYQEMERKRQNRIENLFEKYYHKCKNLETPLITIKPVQKSPPAEEMKLPFTALDMTESPVQLNVAEWQHNQESTTTEQNTHTTGGEAITDSRTTELADLLQRVNRQRELLIREVSSLPASSNLQDILQDEEILKIACPCPKNAAESKGSATTKTSTKGKVFVSTATSPLAVISPSDKIKDASAKTSKIQNSSSTSSKREVDTSNSAEISADITIKRHKKVKVKKQKHALKDEETQTSPAICKKSLSPKQTQKLSSSTIDKSADEESKKSKATTVEHEEKLCQIIIKLAEESSVQISTSSAAKEISLKPKNTVLVQQQPIETKTRKDKSITTKGKEHRTPQVTQQRRLSNDVSTSTAYMSPPDIPASHTVAGQSKVDKQRTLYKDMLKNKPQQTNIDRPDSSGRRTKQVASSESNKPQDKNINPHLLKYIQKLLSMSRQSIDELTVSSVSDVSTPGLNVTDSADNTSIVQLHNVMSHFNLSFTDIQRYLSSESSSSSINNIEANQPIVTEAVVHASDQQDEMKQDIPEDESHLMPYSSILSKFTELAQSSCDKISNLTSMIDKIRLEKERLLSPLSSDKNDNSYTSYLELPPKFTTETVQTEVGENKPKQTEEDSSSSSTSIGQDTIDRYLLSVGENNGLTEANAENNDIPNSNTATNEFVPMLGGIPKYEEDDSVPLLNFANANMNNYVFNTTSKPKPPPSLLRNAAKYNLNIDMTPHELSTIVELDTVASSRNVSEIMIQRPRTPDEHIPSKDIGDLVCISKSDESSSTQSEFITISPDRYLSPREDHQPSLKKTTDVRKDIEHAKKTGPKSAMKKSQSKSPKSEISGVQPLSSDKSSSSPEDREAVLRNMGLGWAVSTLKKTQESLALSSSSDSSKKHVSFRDSSNSNSNSDVSLKEVLSKQFLKRLSSSSLLTDSSDSSPYIHELQDISEIAGAATSQSRDRSQQRTSTPVQQHSKSTDSKNKSKDHLFTGDSDLSSVRLLSDENLFLSIPNLTLDTNKSLNKTKK